jgi:flagellar basal-body rod modification protein FlgD
MTIAATQAATATTSSSNALGSLAGNFSDFLHMLMTQLKNQDPTSPMDANKFTTELVQFSGVEQQINTNSSLTQLIQLTQSQQVLQSASIVGHQVSVTSDKLSLQNGAAGVAFTTPVAEPVNISITDSTGAVVTQSQISTTQGSNQWSWNGQNGAGTQMANGVYNVTVTSATAGQTAAALPFTVIGTATDIAQSGTTLNLQMGSLSTAFSNVTAVH